MPDLFWVLLKIAGYLVIGGIAILAGIIVAGTALFIVERLYRRGDEKRHYRGLYESMLRHLQKGGVTVGR